MKGDGLCAFHLNLVIEPLGLRKMAFVVHNGGDILIALSNLRKYETQVRDRRERKRWIAKNIQVIYLVRPLPIT